MKPDERHARRRHVGVVREAMERIEVREKPVQHLRALSADVLRGEERGIGSFAVGGSSSPSLRFVHAQLRRAPFASAGIPGLLPGRRRVLPSPRLSAHVIARLTMKVMSSEKASPPDRASSGGRAAR